MGTLPVVVFNYKVSDLLEEVTKRTSYLGKMRSTEQEPYLVDRMSLTSGEDFMFEEFLEEAVHETYDWVKAFGRNIPMYDKIVSKYSDVPMYKDYGVIARDAFNYFEFAIDKSVKVDITELLKEDGQTLFVGHDVIQVDSVIEDVEVIAEHKLVLHTMLDGLDVYTSLNYNRSKVIAKGSGALFQGEQIPFDFIESDDEHEIKGAELYITIKVKPVNSMAIKKGTYVEYRTDFSDESVFDLYKVNADCTNADWKDFSCMLDYDPRGCVVYMLERKDCFDKNMLTSTDRALKEAIINRIMYLWCEYVNAPEADKYLLKFEEYGHKAQLGMNARTKDFQRKYKLF